jgi:hypothetical protein
MKYDKHHIDKIIKSLENGDGRVRACKEADISYQCFLNWMEDEVEFLEAIKKAEDSGNDKIKDICKRKIIEDPSWQSGAWWLERNFPGQYKNRSDITTNDKEINQLPTIINITHESDEAEPPAE